MRLWSMFAHRCLVTSMRIGGPVLVHAAGPPFIASIPRAAAHLLVGGGAHTSLVSLCRDDRILLR